MLSEMPVQLPKPEIVVVDVTIKEIYEALEKDGFEHLRGTWFAPGGACVLGQAAINLGVAAASESYKAPVGYFDDWHNYRDFRQEWEDNYGANSEYYSKYMLYSLQAQLNKWSIDKESIWYPIEYQPYNENVMGLANAIIYWNDRADSKGDFVLQTYAEVAAMAKAILEPYFNETVKLLKYEYPDYQVS